MEKENKNVKFKDCYDMICAGREGNDKNIKCKCPQRPVSKGNFSTAARAESKTVSLSGTWENDDEMKWEELTKGSSIVL